MLSVPGFLRSSQALTRKYLYPLTIIFVLGFPITDTWGTCSTVGGKEDKKEEEKPVAPGRIVTHDLDQKERPLHMYYNQELFHLMLPGTIVPYRAQK